MMLQTIGKIVRLPKHPVFEDQAERLLLSVSVTSNPSGWLPLTAMMIAAGVGMIAAGAAASRADQPWAVGLLWAGLLTLFVPASLRLLAREVSAIERLGTLMLLGLAFFVIKYLQSPLSFTYYDELLHWRTLQDLLSTNRLFSENSMLPVSPFFPGLEMVTVALTRISGLDPYVSAQIILLLARMVLIISLYVFYQELMHSSRVAAVAVLVYMTNPAFITFDGQFAYESLALPLAVFAAMLMARQSNWPHRTRPGLSIAAVLAVLAVTVTHHVSSYVMVAFFLLWVASHQLGKLWGAGRFVPSGLAIIATVFSATWIFLVATPVVGYLSQPVFNGGHELLRVLLGEAGPRQLFTTSDGQLIPLWERITVYITLVFCLVGLPVGLLLLWRSYRRQPLAIALGLAALLYPLSNALRLTNAGSDIAFRAGEFIYIALSLCVGLFILFVIERWPLRNASRLTMAGMLGLMLLGGVIAGWGPRGIRLPGPYIVAADQRSVERQGISAAEWFFSRFGPNNRIAGDRINALLMGSIGHQRPVSSQSDHYTPALLFGDSTLDGDELDAIRRFQIDYLLVDHRMTEALPWLGFYFDEAETEHFIYREPLPKSAVNKFNSEAIISRLYDSGAITIYDLQALARDP